MDKKPSVIDLKAGPDNRLVWNGESFPCALGAAGISRNKREGDRATPAGQFPLRRVLYRPDRLAPPWTKLPTAPISPSDAWCDDPSDPLYNQQVRQPYNASYEVLWRTDELYDLIVVLGHNDAPVVPGRGSAIFLHVAHRDYAPTQGCVALARAHLLTILEGCDPAARLCIEP